MSILQNLLTLAETHSKSALETKNLHQVLQNLKIVKQSIEIACLLDPKSSLDSNSDLILELLLSSISGRMERAACYRLYSNFCQQHNVQPLSKSVFFDFLQQEKFQIKRTSGCVYIAPPNSGRGFVTELEVQSEFERRLKSAQKTLSLPLPLISEGVQ